MPDTKRCTRCKEVKSTDDFYRHNKTADGLQYICKDCHNDSREKDPLEREKVESRRKVTGESLDPSAAELAAVESMAERIIRHRNTPNRRTSSQMVPMKPVDEVREELGLSWPRWHRLCSTALDIADGVLELDNIESEGIQNGGTERVPRQRRTA